MDKGTLITPLDAMDVVEHMLDAFALHEILLDKFGNPIDYIFLAVNSAFEQMTGFKGEDLIGHRVKEIIPNLEPIWIERYAQVALTGVSTIFRHYDINLKKWWQVTAFCPRLGRFAVFFRDITVDVYEENENLMLRQLNEVLYRFSRREWPDENSIISEALIKVLELSESQELCHYLKEPERTVNHFVCLDHPNAELQDVAEEELKDFLRKPGAYLLGKSETAQPEQMELEDWLLVIQNQEAVFQGLVFKGFPASKKGYGVEIFKSYFNEIYNIYNQFRLSQEKKILEQQFLQAQKLKSLGIQASVVAHDFNNLLAAILGKISILGLKPLDHSSLKQELHNLEKIVLQGKDLTTQLLSFVGMDSLEMHEVDLQKFLHDLEPLLRASIPKNIYFKIKKSELPENSYVWADVGRLRQALYNLVVNAADAIGNVAGEIKIVAESLELSDQSDWKGLLHSNAEVYYSLAVIDDGPGIPPEKIDKIFEPFFTTKEKGHGLGLSSVFNIIKEHRGNIRVQSTLGQGARFEVILPKYETPKDGLSVQMVEPLDRCLESDQSKSTLLVDDEPWLLEVNKETFECFGHRVKTALNGEEALKIFQSESFDLVVLDLTMPGLSGQETWQAMKEMNPEQKIIILTGYSAMAIPSEMQQDPNTCFLQKPFEFTALTEKIESLFRQ